MNGGTRRPSGAVVVDAVSTGTLQNTVARLSGVSGQRLVLRWVGGSEPGRELPIPTTAALVLGRSADADVGVRDLAVSRSHARIAWQGDQLFIADLVSANGTFVNGALIRTPTRLGPGDEIMLGDTTLRLCKSRGGSSCSAPTPMVAIDVDMAFRETIRAIGGALEYVPLADVMQLLAGTRKTGELAVHTTEASGRIHFAGGRVVFAAIEGRDARAEESDSRSSVLRMLSWKEGRYELLAARRGVTPAVDVSVHDLLMEAASQTYSASELMTEDVLLEDVPAIDEHGHPSSWHTIPARAYAGEP